MSLICIPQAFLDGIKSRLLKHCNRTWRMNQSLRSNGKFRLFFVCTFGDYLAPVLIAAHTANNVDFGGEPKEDEGYESEP